ncbi:MAG: hypothetical protein ISR59_12465 [Anaerolineales bacterium]|uniref:Uncharacterized protein n=1 Tax=Candidatus Desulfolinea nitratireducens TaxID=2841698 RepID=A0A8J6TIY1_9CHLR|nr:hypothetical protein [Candidatus Desulfolinea nitratireducens]MBL6961911.1 hypothetical protein [Anaerolineales bacterium]
MPLNLFKGTSKPNKKPAKKPNLNHPKSSPDQQKKRYAAAVEFLEVFQGRMPLVGGKPHAGTVLSVAARLAGTSQFRAINKKDVDPGVVVLSEEVNQAYPKLLKLFAFYCKKNGIDVMAKRIMTEFPEKDRPLMDLTQTQTEYQHTYNEIMKKHGLNYLESAQAGMIICSIIFGYHCIKNKDIDPYVATGIVAMGVVEGAKTSPVSLDAKPIDSPSQAVPANDSRFVIGEISVVIQDVQKNGGQYTLLNPMVEAKLKEANIDPQVVYIQGLKTQLEEKVSRVDFINMDIDEILGQKQKDDLPVHVFLAFWLDKEAVGYGYQRSGNSWVLKK